MTRSTDSVSASAITAHALVLLVSACTQTPDPEIARPTPAAAGTLVLAAPSASPSAQPTLREQDAAAANTPIASAQTAPPAPAEPAEAPLLDGSGQPLPQTEEGPSSSSPQFRKRMELLARAIIEDNPELALSTFFPLVAYRQVKDVARPERDYELRLLANFRRDVHGYHKKLGRDASLAKFAGVDVPEQSARWMKPGSEGNKVGYFRVLRSTLRFTLADERQLKLELTSLISWRGEWYVVHVSGFK